MVITESHIQNTRQFYRKRRNIIRRIILSGCIVIYLFAGYKFYNLAKNITPSVEIYGNRLLNPDYIYNFISSEITNKNFLHISPRKLSNDLFSNTGLIQDIIIRRYVAPKFKISVYLAEKKIWAKLIRQSADANSNYKVITTDGYVVPIDFLNKDLIPNDLSLVFLVGSGDLKPEKYCLIKDELQRISKIIGLNIEKVMILKNPEKDELEIYCDNNLKIKAGSIDETLNKRIDKLLKSANVLKNRSFMIESIDLTLETGLAVKELKEPKNITGFSLFMPKKD